MISTKKFNILWFGSFFVLVVCLSFFISACGASVESSSTDTPTKTSSKRSADPIDNGYGIASYKVKLKDGRVVQCVATQTDITCDFNTSATR